MAFWVSSLLAHFSCTDIQDFYLLEKMRVGIRVDVVDRFLKTSPRWVFFFELHDRLRDRDRDRDCFKPVATSSYVYTTTLNINLA